MAEVQTTYCDMQMDRFPIVLIPPFFSSSSMDAYLSVIHLVERLGKKKK